MSAGHGHEDNGPPWMNRLLLILTFLFVLLMVYGVYRSRH